MSEDDLDRGGLRHRRIRKLLARLPQPLGRRIVLRGSRRRGDLALDRLLAVDGDDLVVLSLTEVCELLDDLVAGAVADFPFGREAADPEAPILFDCGSGAGGSCGWTNGA